MVVFLNGSQPFPVYGIDTEESRFSRVAWMMKTHPIFLRTDPSNLLEIGPSQTDEKTAIVAEDLYSQIISDAKTSMDFGGFYESRKDRFSTPFEIVLYTWLTHLPDFESNEGIITLDIESKYPDVNVKQLLEHKNYDQAENIQVFLHNQAQIEKELSVFDTVVPVEMDKVEVQKITFEVRFKIDVDLVEIFDRLRMSKELPYVNNGPDRHKIYKHFRYLGENWELGDLNAVQFYVLNTKFPPAKFQEKYYSQGIIVLSDEHEGEAIMAIETVVGAKNNLDDLIDRVFSSLNIKRDLIVQIRQQSVSSVVNIPKQRFNRFLLADIVSNDPFVSSLCFMDEAAKIGRIRAGLTFFYQPVGAEEKVTISLSETTTEMKDHRRSREMYPLDSRYIRVRINKARDEHMTREIAMFVGKIFHIYLRQKGELLQIYQAFIPKFVETIGEAGLQPLLSMKRGGRLQDLVPQIFIAGYARKCANPPEIVDNLVAGLEAKAKDYILDNFSDTYKQAMLFPKTPDEGPQHWYACKGGKYPGLRANVLRNNDQFPYLPCCYPKEQTGKTNYKNYYLEMGIGGAESSFSYVLKTPKFVNKGERGLIPTNLERLFQSLMDRRTSFYRTGTPLGPGSFVEAVSIAMGRPCYRQEVTEAMFAACRQNAWSSTSEQLRATFLNREEYINPSIYYRALEEYFGCYIYLFTRTEDNRGAIIHPLHKHTFLRYKREPRPAVLILEHMGSESDAALLPQSEVIIAVEDAQSSTAQSSGPQSSTAQKPLLTFTGKFAETIDDIYYSTVVWYAGTLPVRDVNPALELFKNITSQGIDSTGKTRTFVVSFKGKDVYLLSDPLPPLTIKEKGSFRNNESGLIQQFIQEEKLTTVGVTPDTYIVKKGERTFYLPYRVTTTSTLGRYNQNQRIARYLQEYAYHLYSLYAREKGMNPNNINAFLREKTTVKKGYVYPKISRRFDLNGAYLESGKLIVQNLEMAQRIGYSIELLMRRQPTRLTEYAKYSFIQDYYLDRNDFVTEQDEVILMTNEALKEWVEEKPTEYILHDIPTAEKTLYYLNLRDQVVLIQLAESFENAVHIAKVWNQEGYNSQSVLSDEVSSYMYYIFETPQKITVRGESKNKVLVWREGDELKYGAILM